MLKGTYEEHLHRINEQTTKKYLSKHTEQYKSTEKLNQPKHKSLDEEIRPLSMINPGVKQLNGVKGVFIKETFMMSNMFSWNTSNVFAIYEADSQGKILNENSNPILYAVAQMDTDCSCASFGTSQMAITTKLNEAGSDGPFILLKEERSCCGYNPCNIFINDKGNNNLIGKIDSSCRKNLTLTNNYVKNLQIQKPVCNCKCNTIDYEVNDSDGHTARLTKEINCCNCSNPVSYLLGFPPKYNEDQNTLLLSMTIFLGFLNYQSSKKKK